MCGIAGLVDTQVSRPQLIESGATMAKALEHRGPDDHGLWCHESLPIVLSHQRLAIQDLSSSGHQPMSSASGRFEIVFNGEIYNFHELSIELRKLGCSFRGASDTEVLLAAIENWGLTEALRRLVGMFAFGLWDHERRILSLCRDRLGEKPLYYGWLDGMFFFASELKALEVTRAKPQLVKSPSAIAKLLKYGYIPAPFTVYESVYKLPPGTFLDVAVPDTSKPACFSEFPGAAENGPQEYWSVRDAVVRGRANAFTEEREAIESLEALLKVTIKRQMISDVSLGAFLSGGIDSTLVCALAQEQSQAPVNTYTVGFDEAEHDESGFAQAVASHLGTRHQTIRASAKECLGLVPEIARIFDEPFADSSQIPTYLVSKLARQHVTVCLSGDGGDELFGGYNRYLFAQRIWEKAIFRNDGIRRAAGRAIALPAASFWDTLNSISSRIIRGSGKGRQLLGLKMQKLGGFLQCSSLDEGYDYLLSSWFHPDELLTTDPLLQESCVVLPNELQSFVDRAMYVDQIGYLPGDNLAKVDRASMAVSLETRLPLLSHEILELSWRIPSSMKIRDTATKWVLREILKDRVPTQLTERPKMGFSIPLARWLQADLREWAHDLLSTARTHTDIPFSIKTIETIWDEHVTGRRDHSQKLWSLLMFFAWAEHRK